MFQPCSPPGMPQPSIRSSIVVGSSSGTWSRAACTIMAASWSGRVSFNAPLNARPIGERVAATMTASGMGVSFQGGPGGAHHGQAGARLALGAGRSAQVEHDAGLHVALLDVVEAVVDLVEFADLVDDPGAALGVDLVDLGEVLAGADDGPADGDAPQDRLEGRQVDVVVGGQGDEDQGAAAA